VTMIVYIALSVPLGIFAAVARGRWPDLLIRLVAVAGLAVPPFWLGFLLQLVFYRELGWLRQAVGRIAPSIPPPPFVTGFYLLDAPLAGDWPAFGSAAIQLIFSAADSRTPGSSMKNSSCSVVTTSPMTVTTRPATAPTTAAITTVPASRARTQARMRRGTSSAWALIGAARISMVITNSQQQAPTGSATAPLPGFVAADAENAKKNARLAELWQPPPNRRYAIDSMWHPEPPFRRPNVRPI